MDVRSAAIVIDDAMLARAVTAHLATAILSHTNTSEEYSAQTATVDVVVDDMWSTYSILHVITHRVCVSGLILGRSTYTLEETDRPTRMEYVLACYDGTDFEVIPHIYSVSEDYAVSHENMVTLKLLEKFYV